MLKHMLLVGAAAMSFPALAQNQPVEDPTAPPPPEQSEPLPDTTEPAPVPDSAPPAEPVSAPERTPDTSAPADPTSEPAPSSSAATPAQVAQIVDQEFPTYDADANGSLNETEFAAWMKRLRTATDPSVDPESEDVRTWIGQAFAAADADKSGGVDKAELTNFLSRGA